jgi:hypothetical protein
VGLFGRRSRRGRGADESEGADDLQTGHVEGSLAAEFGPYDAEDAPDDGLSRLDLGSLLLPVPDGVQLQVEMNPDSSVRAVNVLTPLGQFTVNAYAAPRSGGLWEEICGELAEEMRGQGAAVHSEAGDWGQELVAGKGELALRFIGVDGPRWMVRGVVVAPPDGARAAGSALRDMLRATVVVRGTMPMPVRTALPIDLPPAIAEHIAQAQQGDAPG